VSAITGGATEGAGLHTQRLEEARHAGRVLPDVPLDEDHLRTLALVGTLDLGAALASGLDATLQRIVDVLHDELAGDVDVGLVLWSARTRRFTASASTLPGWRRRDLTPEVRPDGLTAWIVTHGEPLCVNVPERDPFGRNPILRPDDRRAYAGLPVRQGDDVVGVLHALRAEPFAPADLRFLATIANRCGVVINTARATERTRELLARAEELAAITRSLAGLGPLDQRFSEVAARLGQLLGGHVVIAVSTPSGDHRVVSGTTPAHDDEAADAMHVDVTVDEATVALTLRSESPDDEATETLHTVAELIGLAAAREHAAAALAASNTALEQFAHVASHDLKSPLASVIGFIDLVLSSRAETLDTATQALLERALAGGERMRDIIDSLLAYAKVQREDVERVPTSLDSLVGQVLGVLAHPIEDSGADIRVVGDLPMAHVDPTAFRIVVQNVVANALKYVPEGDVPEVEISGRELDDGGVELVVADRGIGVAPEDRERVFELFQRASARHRGSGIGLATVARIVASHGGQVWLEQNAPLGTRVVVHLPPL
jgi:signal transduction histidine kinase